MNIISANERVFQGILWNKINEILKEEKEISFSHILQEQNIGVDEPRFADGIFHLEDNNSQILHYKFLYEKLEIKGTKITLPRSPEDCNKILRILKHDFEKFSSQIKAMLKTYRSKAHYISIYRDLVMGKKI